MELVDLAAIKSVLNQCIEQMVCRDRDLFSVTKNSVEIKIANEYYKVTVELISRGDK